MDEREPHDERLSALADAFEYDPWFGSLSEHVHSYALGEADTTHDAERLIFTLLSDPLIWRAARGRAWLEVSEDGHIRHWERAS